MRRRSEVRVSKHPGGVDPPPRFSLGRRPTVFVSCGVKQLPTFAHCALSSKTLTLLWIIA